jgi:hypothetical protein
MKRAVVIMDMSYPFLSDSKLHYMGEVKTKLSNLPLIFIGDKTTNPPFGRLPHNH